MSFLLRTRYIRASTDVFVEKMGMVGNHDGPGHGAASASPRSLPPSQATR